MLDFPKIKWTNQLSWQQDRAKTGSTVFLMREAAQYTNRLISNICVFKYLADVINTQKNLVIKIEFAVNSGKRGVWKQNITKHVPETAFYVWVQ